MKPHWHAGLRPCCTHEVLRSPVTQAATTQGQACTPAQAATSILLPGLRAPLCASVCHCRAATPCVAHPCAVKAAWLSLLPVCPLSPPQRPPLDACPCFKVAEEGAGPIMNGVTPHGWATHGRDLLGWTGLSTHACIDHQPEAFSNFLVEAIYPCWTHCRARSS